MLIRRSILTAILMAQAAGGVAADLAAAARETLKPWSGPAVRGVDPTTLAGKAMCGYQGWFAAEGDGAGRGWYHWKGRHGFQPGSCSIDLWPDVSELEPDERFATPFRHADGRVAEVFSSQNRKTVVRHFRWMKEHGIDGVFLQRFVGEVSRPEGQRQFNTVLAHARAGAHENGRVYAMMYDLSGQSAAVVRRIVEDWTRLRTLARLTDDPAYLRHRGRPVVALWGFGFDDGRRYGPREGLELVKFFKDPERGGPCTVLLGVPTGWRTLDRDCIRDPVMLDLVRAADIVSPWTVGRFGSPDEARHHAATRWGPDLEWCRANGKDYLPVVFPGFSWHNMNPEDRLDATPRLKGRFLWTQYAELKKLGATMVYQAMFDEVDEGTAIFKCTNDVPVGKSKFVTYEGLPSDYYLKLVGRAARMIRGEIPLSEDPP
jgi:hypothetical protein